MTFVSVTVAANATFHSNGQLYAAGESLDVAGFMAEVGKFHGVFNP